MGTRWMVVLVGGFTAACSGGRGTGNGITAPPTAAGTQAGGNDAGQKPDASPIRVEPSGGAVGTVVQTPAGGAGGNVSEGTGGLGPIAAGSPAAGSYAPVGGHGGAAHGGSSGTPSGGTGGTVAPTEHVLWSQRFAGTLEPGMPGFPDATMGLTLSGGSMCRFGFVGAPSGSTATFPTDGVCITQALGVAGGQFVVYDTAGKMAGGSVGGANLVGWAEAITGHSVTYLRRTQTYSLTYLGGDNKTNFGTFDGTWEAWGY